jgi:hypothetical protein
LDWPRASIDILSRQFDRDEVRRYQVHHEERP